MALDKIPVLLFLRVCLEYYYYSMIKPLYYHLQLTDIAGVSQTFIS